MIEIALLPGEKADAHFAGRYPLRILIADDVYVNRRLLILMLKSLGYEADARENGRECLEAVLNEQPYDLLLSDIDMPEMNGIECARAIRQAGFDLPIVAVTALPPETARIDCADAGMCDFLAKPVGLTALMRTLREVSLRKWLHQANSAVLEQAA